MTIKQQGGVFGRNPTFNDVTTNDLTAKDVTTENLKVDVGIADIQVGNLAAGNAAVNLGRDDTSITTGNPLGFVQFLGSDNTAGSLTPHAYIKAFASSTHSAGSNPTSIAIGTTAIASETIVDNFIFGDNGDLTVANGNLVIGTSGKGIDFSATSGTGTSELFDDYEEGAWTPEVADAQTGGNTATGTFTGYYTKIGRMVNLMCSLENIDTTGMTSGNALYVRNLPYVPASLAGAQRAISNVFLVDVTFDTSAIVTAEIPDNFTYARINECSSGGGRTFVTVGDLASGTADINLQFNYYV